MLSPSFDGPSPSPQTGCASVSNGIFKTTDGGITWKRDLTATLNYFPELPYLDEKPDGSLASAIHFTAGKNNMHYIAHLSKDAKLRKVLSGQDPVELLPRKNIPLRLCASIMSQQLSTKVAKVIFHRFLDLYGRAEPTPQQIADTPFETLRAIGLSNAKTQYVLNVAQFALDQKLNDKKLAKMGNEEIIALLTQIKGVGQWTVEMLLMFTLGREDVFAVDDYGIQSAMKKLYKLDDGNKKEFKQKMQAIAAKWSPYRTYACRHLWQWKDDG